MKKNNRLRKIIQQRKLHDKLIECVCVLSRLQPLPAVPIKDEPLDDTDDDFQMKCIDESDDMMDPTMFLERSEHEGDVPIMVSDHHQPH